jgi:hypothetical protein
MTMRNTPPAPARSRTPAPAASRALTQWAAGCLWLLLATVASGVAPEPAPKGELVRPAGAVVVPDHYLRAYDPLTFFFDADIGPAAGGPEDDAKRHVQIAPERPGAYRWLNARTLQLRPTEAWPPLTPVRVTLAGRDPIVLQPLMPPPTATVPEQDTQGLPPLQEIRLTFPTPMDPAVLKRMLRIELRPLPGARGGDSVWLREEEIAVKPEERTSRSQNATYLVALRQPIPEATAATVHLRLAADDDPQLSFFRLRFATAEPFRVAQVSCGGTAGYPIAPGGVEARAAQALRCNPAQRLLTLDFTSELAAVDPIALRNLVRLSPAPAELDFAAKGRTLEVRGRFLADTLYRLDLAPTPMKDKLGRSLAMPQPSTVHFVFPPAPPRFEFGKSGGQVLERFGPQMLPVSGQGVERIDLRIYPIRALDRNFWPFPNNATVVTVDDLRPPPPGAQVPDRNTEGKPGTDKGDADPAAKPSPGQDAAAAPTEGADKDPDEGAAKTEGQTEGEGQTETEPPEGEGQAEPDEAQRAQAEAAEGGQVDNPEGDTGDADWQRGETLKRQIASLGSPAVSQIVQLPLAPEGNAARFGLDLKSHFAKIRGANAAGSYLVGLRRLDEGRGRPTRQWIRLQVTDLTLSTVETREQVMFSVTSLAKAQPVAAARIRVQGLRTARDGGRKTWVTVYEGHTGADGRATWAAPGDSKGYSQEVRRVVVETADDTLVLDPHRPREQYTDGRWGETADPWLQWTQNNLTAVRERPVRLCHLFPERPVIRPEEPVHLKGYLRERFQGKLKPKHGEATLVVEGPGKREWRYPVSLTAAGSFHHQFLEPDLPTGEYHAHLTYDKEDCGRTTFKKEAYRLPTFEVRLHAPDASPLDTAFTVDLTAHYYAGGRVAERPVRWRVTRFPHTWEAPKSLAGFLFSTDARFSGAAPFPATPVEERDGQTDADGATKLEISPALEPDARPRRYVVEATVTGADDITVTATKEVVSVPPFVLGMRLARFLEDAKEVAPEILAVDGEGKPVAGQPLTVRLARREWHSHLKAGDFSQGVAKYVTEVVDVPIKEVEIQSEALARKVPFAIDQSGVYVVEVESRDKLGRAQILKADLFVGGRRGAVGWPRQGAGVFKATTDKAKYIAGETANLILESPFASGRALAVVEAPEGNRYDWIDIDKGAGVYRFPVERHHAPKIPVHFLLYRGRAGDRPPGPDGVDLGKPATLAATTWVEVDPAAQRVEVKLTHPARAKPGETVEITVELKGHEGKPLAGELTLWLVDQAVMSLGKEQRLDPLPDFLPPRESVLRAVDTRNLVPGFLPYQEEPGGDEGEKEGPNVLDRITVRKKFIPVPYYNPEILVGPDGKVTVKVELPDNLTNFQIRAKVASGEDRFGTAAGRIEVRLPVVVMTALPRFLRPGDQFTAGMVARVVEGPGGPGHAEIKVEGATVKGGHKTPFTWPEHAPVRLGFAMEVPDPAPEDAHPAVRITLGALRDADGVGDGMSLVLPVRADREVAVERQIQELGAPGETLTIPAPLGAARPGTLQRRLWVTRDPALGRVALSLEILRRYPYGCTEQRVSQMRALLAARRLQQALGEQIPDKELQGMLATTEEWIGNALDPQGRLSYWPGSAGNVFLTAWSASMLTEARAAGLEIDEKLQARLLEVLRQSLRSDYRHFVQGEAYTERAFALATLAEAGQLDAGYATELARDRAYLGQRALALVLRGFQRLPSPSDATAATLAQLREALWDGVEWKQQGGKAQFAGFKSLHPIQSYYLLPSETTNLAETLRTVAGLEQRDEVRINALKDALLARATPYGFGDSHADASALLALATLLEGKPGEGPDVDKLSLTAAVGAKEETLALGPAHPLVHQRSTAVGEMRLQRTAGDTHLAVISEARYVPAAPLAERPAVAAGLVVQREHLRVTGLGTPLERTALAQPGQRLTYRVGEVVEEHVQLILPQAASHVALTVPLAAGFEPLNPHLATAPPEARTANDNTLTATYEEFLDDRAGFYFTSLDKGTYHLYFRVRATVPGVFQQPAALAERMYARAVRGTSVGALVEIQPVAEAASAGAGAVPAATPGAGAAPAPTVAKPAAPAHGIAPAAAGTPAAVPTAPASVPVPAAGATAKPAAAPSPAAAPASVPVPAAGATAKPAAAVPASPAPIIAPAPAAAGTATASGAGAAPKPAAAPAPSADRPEPGAGRDPAAAKAAAPAPGAGAFAAKPGSPAAEAPAAAGAAANPAKRHGHPTPAIDKNGHPTPHGANKGGKRQAPAHGKPKPHPSADPPSPF